MEWDIDGLIDCVLKENEVFTCRDGDIEPLLIAAKGRERLRIIREEYAKRIKIDKEVHLAGTYPTVCFYKQFEKIHFGGNWKAACERFLPYRNTLYIDGGNHFSVNFERVLRDGISGLLSEIGEAVPKSEEQREFLAELEYAAEAIIAWAEAHGDALRRAAKETDLDERRQELIRMAHLCERVPRFPAENFREAIQSYCFIFILAPDGLGCLDRYLYPYYRADIEKGILTREEALLLIKELFIKIFARYGKDEARSGDHHGVLAGYTEDGKCAHNDCTSLILQALTELPIWRPQFSYRVTAKTSPEALFEAVEANCKRPDVVMFLNDDVIVKGLCHLGVIYDDAVNYSSSGCNETILTGCSQMGALEGHVNLMHSLERMLSEPAALLKFADFDAFYQSYERYLREDLHTVFDYAYLRDKTSAEGGPWILHSLLTDGCISSMNSIIRGGARYNFCTFCLTGLINLADSMSVIRQTIFEEGRFTLREISHFLSENWQGYETERAYILNHCRYFGNDDDSVDLLINKIAASVNCYAAEHTPYRGGRYLFGTLTGYELAHIVFGGALGASVDGRYAQEPLSASIAPYSGTDRRGLTAFLKSAAKIDGDLIQSSVVVNLKMDRRLVDSKEKRERLAAALRTYFDLGGIQLQINYLSAGELLEAQCNPEKYSDLRVRITGFSGFFTALDKELQNEVVKRYLYNG